MSSSTRNRLNRTRANWLTAPARPFYVAMRHDSTESAIITGDGAAQPVSGR
ncbi:hypothetical protein [Dichotomicrobium thermohalophilum]|uniref:hypothetical protein n=1 Tax=Dichotomicrobium thermohalophilum TaxID=933063 RepID=UPI0014748765|nr:hypothetical protein [Dichotomicrobium thermohalophilum]